MKKKCRNCKLTESGSLHIVCNVPSEDSPEDPRIYGLGSLYYVVSYIFSERYHAFYVMAKERLYQYGVVLM